MIDNESDPRRAKTQRRIFEAFSRLVQSRRYDTIQVADIVREADIGRSTFYEHFSDKNNVLAKSIAGMMGVIAEAVCGLDKPDMIELVLEHLWERRALGRIIFSGDTKTIISEVLRQQLQIRCEPKAHTVDPDLILISEGIVEVLRQWITGHLSMPQSDLADWIRHTGRHFR